MSFLFAIFGFVRNSWIGKAIAFAGGVLVAVLLIFTAGKRAQRRDQKIADLEGYINVRRKSDAAKQRATTEVDSLDDDALDNRLRQRGAFRD